jgi:hypothetical protein
MSRVDELRAQLALAEAEERLAQLKQSGDAETLEEQKEQVRYARWVARGGPQQERDALARGDGHTNRACAAYYTRWSAEQQQEGRQE